MLRRSMAVAGSVTMACVVFAASGCGLMGGASDESVAWMNKTCGALNNFVSSIKGETPKLETEEDVKAYTEGFIAKFDKAHKEFSALEKAPMEGGDEIVKMMVTMMSEGKAAFTASQQKTAEAEKTKDPAKRLALLEEGQKELTAGMEKFEKTAKDFDQQAKSVKAVDVAFNLAENCKGLR